MNQKRSKYGIILALLLIAGGLLTCQFSEHVVKEQPSEADTALIRAWKQEKETLIAQHETKLRELSQRQDSLYAEIQEKKAQLKTTRAKASQAERELYELLTRNNNTPLERDSIKPLIDSYSQYCNQTDSLCDQTIISLEQQVTSKDSSLCEQSGEIIALKQLNSQKEVQIAALHETINGQQKAGRKLIRKTKWLSAGLCLLAGISTSLLITRTIR